VNLKDITGPMLREAAAVYLEEAYAGKPPRRKPPDLSGVRTVEDAVALMDDESRRHAGAQKVRRWVLRLGNARYPNMKLVLEEYLLAGEFVFSVDTHDEAAVKPGDPDEETWRELRQWNLALKKRIEARWKRAGIPTYAALLEVLRRSAPARKGPHRGTVLVVDDEADIADTVEALLAGEGYRVLKASDGAEALEVLGSVKPDLILMDYDMPKVKGTEVCARIRKGKRDRDVPILLATASMVDLSALADADGFLVKPYQKDVLVSFVRHLAGPRPGPEPEGRPAFRRKGRGGPVRSRDRTPPRVGVAGGTDEEE
jgi:CheY-like chemotaxis protein